jgi:protein-disulfide isomerase
MIRRTAFAIAAAFLTGGALLPAVTGISAIPAATAQEAATSEVKVMSMGDPQAPVEVIEYASFTCPHCANFAIDVFPQFKRDYIDTGKVHFINREVYFDRPGLWAGMVARCGDGSRYFGIADMIYEKQKDWTQGQPAQIAGNLRKLGRAAGLEDAQLDACLTDADKAQAMVKVFEETSQADGINATPTFMIDGEKYANMSYDDFRKILDEKLAAKQ